MLEKQPTTLNSEEHMPPRHHKQWVVFLLVIMVLGTGAWAYVRTLPPENFAPDTLIEIPEGYSLQAISKLLEQQSIIRSPLLFNILITHTGKERSVTAGAYLFKAPLSVWEVARRMADGDHGIETRKITLPEGFTNKEMARVLAAQLPQFDSNIFLREAEQKEGYLFPDTYFFFSTATSGEVLFALQENFTKKTGALSEETLAQKKDWGDIVIMASLLEEEAATAEDRRIVAGILWKRMTKGMLLQVDATFAYTLGKGSLELTQDDLKSDSPYNTYRHKGLPPTPITNPGFDAIDAALHPEESKYFYYLSDKNGVMYYAKTFEEHKINKAKYLK